MRGRWTIAACLLLTAACGGYDPPDPLTLRTVPQPDLCRDLKAAAALTAKIDSCVAAPGDGSFGARYSGVHHDKKKDKGVSVSVIVSYQERYDRSTGFDLWQKVGGISGERGAVIGLGQGSVFDPKTRTMAVIDDGLIISVAFQAARPTGDDTLADRLLDVLQQAMELGRRPAIQSSPDRIRISPEIRE